MKIILIREHLRIFVLFLLAMPVVGLTLGFLAGIVGSVTLNYCGIMTYQEGKHVTIFMSLAFFLITFIGAIPIYLTHFRALLRFKELPPEEQSRMLNGLNTRRSGTDQDL